MTRVVVIGGGAAGLSCALSLLDTFRARGGTVVPDGAGGGGRSGGLSLCVLEAREHVGGRVGSEQHGGFIIETGAATVQESAPGFRELTSRLGLQSELVFSDDRARRRFLFREGRLRRLPLKPPEILTSDALSLPARLRLLAEPLVPAPTFGPPASPSASAAPTGDAAARTAAGAEGHDESIAAFFQRRVGDRVTAEIVEPAMAGIYAGDIAELSMRSALPRVWQMEHEHGSLLNALRKTQAARGAAPRLCGFRTGLGTMMGALSRAVGQAGGNVRLCSPAQALVPQSRAGGATATGYRIMLPDGHIDADEVVLALPPPDAARLLSSLDAPLAALYGAVPMAPIVAISLGWPREQVPHPLDGFGFLVPRQERMRDGLRLLGVLFMTSALPDFEQAPKGQVLLRAMYGGTHDPEVERMSDGDLLEQVRRDLRVTLGIWTEPRFIHIQRWAQAIEQYVIGHAARVANIEARLGGLGGLHATGAALHGVAVPDVLRHGQTLGARIAASLPIR